MCEMVPLKLCCENENIITDVLKTIEWGLTSYGPEITVLCTDFLQSIASFVHKQEHFEYFPAYYELNKFLKVIFFVYNRVLYIIGYSVPKYILPLFFC